MVTLPSALSVIEIASAVSRRSPAPSGKTMFSFGVTEPLVTVPANDPPAALISACWLAQTSVAVTSANAGDARAVVTAIRLVVSRCVMKRLLENKSAARTGQAAFQQVLPNV